MISIEEAYHFSLRVEEKLSKKIDNKKIVDEVIIEDLVDNLMEVIMMRLDVAVKTKG